MELTWTPEKRKVSDLKELSNNPRRIKGEAFEKLKQRIAARGFHDVVKVDQDGYVLSGNQRRRALLDLGIKEVYALVPSRPLTKVERDKVILESNRNDGEWDYDILGNEFELEDLLDVGFPKSLAPDELAEEVLNPSNEWQGMPEYASDNKGAVRQILVSFVAHEDVQKFADLIGQHITDKTRSVWYPMQERDQVADLAYE